MSHILAATALVTRPPDELLLVRMRDRGWGLPGGQIEPGEALLDGLSRELLEETGVRAAIGPLAGLYSNIRQPAKLVLAFLATWESGELVPSAETPELAWVARSDALDRVPPGLDHDRLADLLAFDGTVVYRVYSTRPYEVHEVQKLSRPAPTAGPHPPLAAAPERP